MLGGTGGGAPVPAFLMVAVTSWDDLRPPTAVAETEEEAGGQFNGNSSGAAEVLQCPISS